MALQLDLIRNAAERVAASHQMDLVDIEFHGAGKFRSLRVFLEKNAQERARLAALAAAGAESIPAGVPAEALSGTTLEDCAQFATDFGTLLDVEDLVPGAEYTLEVSSPGIERKLSRPADYQRFAGQLAKLQTFSPVSGNRHWTGRIVNATEGIVTLDTSAARRKEKPRNAKKSTKNGVQPAEASATVAIALANIEKAHLLAEI
jgi:ribosome maturation factor RimP